MTNEEFKEMCSTLDWVELIPLLSSSLKDLSIKILVSAIIEAYHPDKETQREYGITGCWEDNLSNILVSPMASLFTSRVDLYDFYKAFKFAPSVFNGTQVDSKPIQEAIRKFVQSHKLYLAEVLVTHKAKFPDEVIQDLNECFGNLQLTVFEKKSFEIEQTIAKSKVERHKMLANENRLSIAFKLDQLFDLEPGSCTMTQDSCRIDPPTSESDEKLFNLPAGAAAMQSVRNLDEIDYSIIRFKNEENPAKVREYSDMLTKIGLKIHFVNYPSMYGKNTSIQVSSPLQLVLDKLDEAILAKSTSKLSIATTNTEKKFDHVTMVMNVI